MNPLRLLLYRRRAQTTGQLSARRLSPRARLIVEGLENRCLLTLTFSEFTIPTPNSVPTALLFGPDGNIWFTEQTGNKIGRVTLDGVFTEYTIPTTVPPDPVQNPTGSSRPTDLAVGPDGALWFGELFGNKIGRITVDGAITEYPLPTPNSQPGGIIAGPDGNLWITENGTNRIGRMTPAGVITEFTISTTIPVTADNPSGSSLPRFIRNGPDGNLWFTEFGANKVARITPAGVITEYPVPTTVTPSPAIKLVGIPPKPTSNVLGSSQPRGLVTGPDGDLWFGEFAADKIGRLDPTTGTITEFPVPTDNSIPFGITGGPDGNLWFAENNAGKFGVITTNGFVVAEFTVPTPGVGPLDLEPGPHSTLIFTESGGNKIGVIQGIVDANHAYVQTLYQDILGRTGSPGELNGWVQLQVTGGTPAVVNGIEHSMEARTRLVQGWYTRYLGRAAKGGEEQGWVQALMGGTSEEQVLADILGSAEFAAHAATLVSSGTANERFIQGLYMLLLNRSASSSEVQNAVSQLSSLGPTGVATAFLGSSEYRRDAVMAYYNSLLHRNADPAGFNFWVGTSLSLLNIREGIEASLELFNNA
jgi:streptogramin lyase